MLLLGLGALVVLVLVALGLMWRRQRRIDQQVRALRAGVDRLRVDVAEVRREVGLDSDGDGGPVPPVVRRKGHLGLVGGIAAGLGVGAAWVREHRAASLTAAAAVVAGVSLLIAAPWDTGGKGRPPSSAPTASPTATAAPPSASPAPTPSSEPLPSEETVPSAPSSTVTGGTAVSGPTSVPAPSSSAPAVTPGGEEPTATGAVSSSPGIVRAPEPSGRGRGTQPVAPPGLAGTASPYLVCVEASATPSVEASACLGGNP